MPVLLKHCEKLTPELEINGEDVDESSALSQLLKPGVMWYATSLYKLGKITLAEAADKSYRLFKKIQLKY